MSEESITPPQESGTPPLSEQSTVRDTPKIDLSGLTHWEIVAVNRHLRELKPEDLKVDGGALGSVTSETARFHGRYEEAVLDAISELPFHDRDKGRAVFTALIESPNESDRGDAAGCVPGLLQADHEFGLTVFERLLRDPSGKVRGSAGDVLSGLTTSSSNDEMRKQVAERRAELGLGEMEVGRLQHAYLLAERGEGIYRLGEVVLQRLIAETEASAPDQSSVQPD